MAEWNVGGETVLYTEDGYFTLTQPDMEAMIHDTTLLHTYGMLGEPSQEEPYFQPTVAAFAMLTDPTHPLNREFGILPSIYEYATDITGMRHHWLHFRFPHRADDGTMTLPFRGSRHHDTPTASMIDQATGHAHQPRVVFGARFSNADIADLLGADFAAGWTDDTVPNNITFWPSTAVAADPFPPLDLGDSRAYSGIVALEHPFQHQRSGVGFSIVTPRVTTDGFDVRNIQTWSQWSAANEAYQRRIQAYLEMLQNQ